MKKTYSQKGFTLIELLVVIAIIGILSSVVLASLSTARNKGKVAAIKSQMASLRSQVELAANGGDYGAIANGAGTSAACDGAIFVSATASAAAIVTGIESNSSTQLFCSGNVAPPGLSTAWSAAVVVPDASGTYCVDSSGNAKTTALGSITTAVQNNGVCI